MRVACQTRLCEKCKIINDGNNYNVKNPTNFNRLQYTSGKLKSIDLYIIKN